MALSVLLRSQARDWTRGPYWNLFWRSVMVCEIGKVRLGGALFIIALNSDCRNLWHIYIWSIYQLFRVHSSIQIYKDWINTQQCFKKHKKVKVKDIVPLLHILLCAYWIIDLDSHMDLWHLLRNPLWLCAIQK